MIRYVKMFGFIKTINIYKPGLISLTLTMGPWGSKPWDLLSDLRRSRRMAMNVHHNKNQHWMKVNLLDILYDIICICVYIYNDDYHLSIMIV